MEGDYMTGDEMEIEVGTLPAMADQVGIIDRAQLEIAVDTANKYPRSITKALEEAHSMALKDERTAETMFYVLPRSDKDIIGPSARLAEVMVYAWRNLRIESETFMEDLTHVTARGTCFDTERNNAIRISVKRRITKANGKRYSDDMIIVTSNAAVSIALRNAVFRIIPRTYTDQVFRAAMQASVGDTDTIAAKREVALSWFGEGGIQPEQVYELLKVHGIDDIGVEQIIRLRGIVNALKDSETTLDAIFNPPKGEEATQELDDALTPDALAGPIPSGKYRGQSYHEALADTDGGPEYVRRYLLPRAIGDLREQLEAALQEIVDEMGDGTETSSSNAPDAGEMPREEAGAVGGASPADDSGASLVYEAWKKADEKAAALVRAGKEFTMDESMRLEELKSANDFEGLLAMDKDFTERLAS